MTIEVCGGGATTIGAHDFVGYTLRASRSNRRDGVADDAMSDGEESLIVLLAELVHKLVPN